MTLKLSIMATLSLVFFSACGDRTNFGKLDQSPYATKECLKELSCGADLSGPPIDKIVVYKKKRRMYTYSKGKLINEFRISLGKNCDKHYNIHSARARKLWIKYQIGILRGTETYKFCNII